MRKASLWIALLFLIFGFIYRVIMTSDGNFIFNMDNARDYVDLREMIELHKPRLIGQTSAIDGFYNGPGWYYLLATSYIASNGDPYAGVILQIILWAVGGYFLLRLTHRFGLGAMLLAGFVWLSSNYITLATAYSFNPNPVTLLTPLFVYLLDKYLTTNSLKYCILTFLLAGIFFNFEMNIGFFMPIIIIATLLIHKKAREIVKPNFWLGVGALFLTVLPQLLFDLKHQFIMSKAVIKFLTSSTDKPSFTFLERLNDVYHNFTNVLTPTFFNQELFIAFLEICFVLLVLFYIFQKRYTLHNYILISILIILIPFIGYLFLPVTINSWHLGAICTASIIIASYIFSELHKASMVSRVIAFAFLLAISFYSLKNVNNFFTEYGTPNMDPSLYANEVAAIDYVYQRSQGKQFKVYAYLPSVIDYPYQYLFWWLGKNKYGYIPKDYAYLPNKPQYIAQKEKFLATDNREDSHLIFLIKEPDRIRQRHLWENSFSQYPLLESTMVGPLVIEIRSDNPNP